MTINEDNGELVVCPFCNAAEYWDCGHLVGSFDRSFCECGGGLIYDRFHDITAIIEENFGLHLRTDSTPKFNSHWLSELWLEAKHNFIIEDADYIHIDECILIGFLIEMLEDAGAFSSPGSTIDPGGPGMTSTVSILFSDSPADVINTVFVKLSKMLNS